MKLKYFIWAFILLFCAFVVQYGFCAYRWLSPPEIHAVFDREGEKLSVDRHTVHLLGDGQGRVPKTMLSHYGKETLSYTLLKGLYSYGGRKYKAKLTISAPLQRTALTALGEKWGTVAVMNYQTGEILCTVTNPTFSPTEKGAVTESMYVNRFLFGCYTPGSVYKIVTLAAALEEDPFVENRRFSCKGEKYFGTDKVVCPVSHGEQTLRDAFRNSCNCAFAAIAYGLGEEKMTAYAEKFGLTVPLSFDGFTTASGRYDCAVSLPWSGVGQGDTKINPCTFLTFLSAVARDGQGRKPYLMASVRDGYKTLYQARPVSNAPVLTPKTAATLQKYLRSNVEEKYGDSYFAGLRVCAKTGTAETGAEKPNATLCGFSLDEKMPIAFLIIAENAGAGADVCLPIAERILECLIDN